MATDGRLLAGKVALVTGAGGGIGAGSARALAQAGADVALFDLRFPDGRPFMSVDRHPEAGYVVAAPGFGNLRWAIIAGTVGPLGFWGGRERTELWTARFGAFAAAADAAGEELWDRGFVSGFVGKIFRRLEGRQ